MEYAIEKIKIFRKEVIKIFLLLFIGQLIALSVTCQIVINSIENLKWQLDWFGIYFTISSLVYIFASKIVRKQNSDKK